MKGGSSSAQSLPKGLSGRSAHDAVALMGATQVVLVEEDVEVRLDLVRAEVRVGAALHAEALVEERGVHALDEAVGAGRADAGRTALHGEEQLVPMRVGAATEFASVVREDGADLDAEGSVEGQHAVVAGRRR